MRKFADAKKSAGGFTLIEVVIALALITIFVFMAMDYSSILNKRTGVVRSQSTKNRILSGIRDLASMPASLRMSMRASIGGVAVNPALLACAGGNPINNCKSEKVYDLTLYSPVIQRNSSGAIIGITAISAPTGSTTQKMRIDTFGAPCTVASADCPLLVSTSFKAQCGPPPLPSTPPSPVTLELVPQKTCTVADVIEVTYTVELDKSITVTDTTLQTFITPVTGTAVVPVSQISGNMPQ